MKNFCERHNDTGPTAVSTCYSRWRSIPFSNSTTTTTISIFFRCSSPNCFSYIKILFFISFEPGLGHHFNSFRVFVCLAHPFRIRLAQNVRSRTASFVARVEEPSKKATIEDFFILFSSCLRYRPTSAHCRSVRFFAFPIIKFLCRGV